MQQPEAMPMMPQSRAMTTTAPGGGMADMMKNPMVLGGLAIAALLAMKTLKK